MNRPQVTPLILLALLALAIRPLAAGVEVSHFVPHPGWQESAHIHQGHLLVSEAGYSKVQIVPLNDPEARWEISTGRSAFDFVSIGGRVMVSNMMDTKITVLGKGFEIVREIEAPIGVTDLAVRDDDVLAVLASDNGMMKIRLSDFETSPILDSESGPFRVAVQGDRVAVVNHRHMLLPDDDALIIRDAELRSLHTFETGGGLRHVAAGSDGLFYAVLRHDARVIAVDPIRMEITREYDAGADPCRAIPCGNLLLVPSASDHRLTVIDLTGANRGVTFDLHQFGHPIRNCRNVVPDQDGTLYFIAEGEVVKATGLIVRKEGGFQLEPDVVEDPGREGPLTAARSRDARRKAIHALRDGPRSLVRHVATDL